MLQLGTWPWMAPGFEAFMLGRTEAVDPMSFGPRLSSSVLSRLI